MSLSQMLFSFNGRINRAKYWLYAVVAAVAVFVAQVAMTLSANEAGEPNPMILAIYIVVMLAVFWFGLTMAVKRFHDRNRSGWFYLLFLVPVLSIWPLAEALFLKGVEGPNRFGDDPLGAPGGEAAAQAMEAQS